MLLVLDRVHRLPEALVAVREQLSVLYQPAERPDDEILSWVDVPEDVAAEDEETAVDPDVCLLHVVDRPDRAVGVGVDDMQVLHRPN